MKLTDTDITMFKALQESEIGKQLLDFLERMTTELKVEAVDTLSDPQDIRAVRIATKRIETEIINRMRLANKKKEVDKDDYV